MLHRPEEAPVHRELQKIASAAPTASNPPERP
jgi:hypothetical protein